MISGLTLLRYDIKTPSGKRPVDTIFQLARYPDLGATISIRKREREHVTCLGGGNMRESYH